MEIKKYSKTSNHQKRLELIEILSTMNIKIIKKKREYIKHEKYIETCILQKRRTRIIRKRIDQKKMPISDRKWIVSLRFENAEGKREKRERERKKKGKKRIT